MALFASKTPRDLNHDPYPWAREDIYGNVMDDRARIQRPPIHGAPDAWHPRPEFDHVQHNEPNPILVRLRAQKSDPTGFVKSGNLARLDVDLTGASLAQIDHARRVLTRLARLKDRS